MGTVGDAVRESYAKKRRRQVRLKQLEDDIALIKITLQCKVESKSPFFKAMENIVSFAALRLPAAIQDADNETEGTELFNIEQVVESLKDTDKVALADILSRANYCPPGAVCCKEITAHDCAACWHKAFCTMES